MANAFKAVGDEMSLQLGTHSMRKTRGWLMYNGGSSIELICKVLNHSSPAVTMAYIGITKAEVTRHTMSSCFSPTHSNKLADGGFAASALGPACGVTSIELKRTSHPAHSQPQEGYFEKAQASICLLCTALNRSGNDPPPVIIFQLKKSVSIKCVTCSIAGEIILENNAAC